MYNFSILLNHNKIFKNISNINTSKNSYMQKKKKSFMYNIRIYYNYSSIKSSNKKSLDTSDQIRYNPEFS